MGYEPDVCWREGRSKPGLHRAKRLSDQRSFPSIELGDSSAMALSLTNPCNPQTCAFWQLIEEDFVDRITQVARGRKGSKGTGETRSLEHDQRSVKAKGVQPFHYVAVACQPQTTFKLGSLSTYAASPVRPSPPALSKLALPSSLVPPQHT